MPTYDYRCNNCQHEFEAFQRMTEKPKRKCPECGKNTLERLIGTGAGVIFKGSGFYETDYRSDSYKKAAEADSKAGKPETQNESKSDSSGESKKSSSSKDTGESPKSKPKKDSGGSGGKNKSAA